jgi:hypothetical protein
MVPRGMPQSPWRNQQTSQNAAFSHHSQHTQHTPAHSAPHAAAQAASSQALIDEQARGGNDEAAEGHVERVPVLAVEDLAELVEDEDAPSSASVQLGRRAREERRPQKGSDDEDDEESVMPRLPPGVKVY